MKLLFLESYYGGSHKYFADGLVENSQYDIDLITLPECNWTWRMLGASFEFFKKIKSRLKNYDGLIVSDLMSLTDFKALAGDSCPPVFLYFHENQVTYPESGHQVKRFQNRGFQYGFIDICNAVVADRVGFNSNFHKSLFLKSADLLIKRMPDFQPGWVIKEIEKKSVVLYPGISFSENDIKPDFTLKKQDPPLIIWNHRWSYDKNPKAFFKMLGSIMKKGVDFRLAILGENPGRILDEFSEAKSIFGEKIVKFGYEQNREDYINWLKQGSIVISTSIQENFGISIIEAIRNGCLPLVPDRLSYPEIIPEEFHNDFIYTSNVELGRKLKNLLENMSDFQLKIEKLARIMERYSWKENISKFDKEFTRLAPAIDSTS